MAIRSIASLTISFGLVSIPVKVYVATESSAAIRFKLMGRSGFHVRQQYVPQVPAQELGSVGAPADVDPAGGPAKEPQSAAAVPRAASHLTLVQAAHAPEPADDELPAPADDVPPAVVDRGALVKGYEFAKGQYVLFTDQELAQLRGASRQTIDIVAFVPAGAVDPVYYDKAYYLAPDKRGHKPYSLLLEALRQSRRSALAKWAWRGKEYVVELRPTDRVLVLQQLLYADEVRSAEQLAFDLSGVSDAEMRLALQVIEQNAVASYDPEQFVDEEKQRILEAVERKIAGKRIVAPHQAAAAEPGGEVIDLVAALQASLKPAAPPKKRPGGMADGSAIPPRKPPARAGRSSPALSSPRRKAK